jgi:LAGLIDADG-like domain
MAERLCERCGKILRLSRTGQPSRRWCSKACQRARTLTPCFMCGTPIWRIPYELKKNARTFCSRTCHGKWVRASQRRYELRLDHFEDWSSDLAYFLGLFASDGNVQTATGQVSFVSIDECNSSFVTEFLARGVPIRTSLTASKKTAYRVSVWGKDLVSALARYGISDRKSMTVRVPTDLPSPLRWAYLRGVLDGDGYVNVDGRVEFGTASPGFAVDLQSILAGVSLPYRLFVTARGYHRISLRIVPSARLAELLYADGGPYLARKRARFRMDKVPTGPSLREDPVPAA